VPAAALTKFDEPLDPRSSRSATSNQARFRPFTIRMTTSNRAPDDLLIVARDAQLKENRVVSPHPIKFQLG
jgi:hypothetical protein